MTELLVGSKKGLFVLRGEPGGPLPIVHRAFPGEVVEYAIRDPESGRYLASVTSGFYGPRLMLADDPTGEWEQATGLVFPEDVRDAAVERIWVVRPAEEPGVLYAGTARCTSRAGRSARRCARSSADIRRSPAGSSTSTAVCAAT